ITARFGVAQQQLVVAFVVAGGLFDRQPILGSIRHAQPEAIGLNALVALAALAGAVGIDAGKQSARGITRLDVRRNVQAVGKLMAVPMLGFDAVVILAVPSIGLAADGVTNPGLGHQVAFISGVDELAARVARATLHHDGGEASSVFDHAFAGTKV